MISEGDFFMSTPLTDILYHLDNLTDMSGGENDGQS